MLEELKKKPNKQITREDIAKLLASIGDPGLERDEKTLAVKELGIKNFQGHGLETSLEDFEEF